MEKLVFVKPSLYLKEKILEYKNEHFEYSEYEIHGSSMLDKLEYEEWLDRIENNKDIADTFIVIRQSDNKIIGIIDIRYELYNDFLKNYAGHIGYSVRPTERRKGYAIQILNEAKKYMYNKNIDKIMLSCFKENVGSRKTILRCGGYLDREFEYEGEILQIFYIEKQTFKLVTPTIEYKEKAIDFVNEFYEYNSPINGCGGLDRFLKNNTYEEWLLKIDADSKREITEEKVPTKTMFLVNNEDVIIGIINIRLALNEKLRKRNGNIGYSIRPTQRGKGYNKINLYLGLLECRKQGLKNVMLDCEKNNLGSAKTIQALGGVLEREYLDDELNEMEQVYWIDVDKSIEENYEKYKSYIE